MSRLDRKAVQTPLTKSDRIRLDAELSRISGKMHEDGLLPDRRNGVGAGAWHLADGINTAHSEAKHYIALMLGAIAIAVGFMLLFAGAEWLAETIARSVS